MRVFIGKKWDSNGRHPEPCGLIGAQRSAVSHKGLQVFVIENIILAQPLSDHDVRRQLNRRAVHLEFPQEVILRQLTEGFNDGL